MVQSSNAMAGRFEAEKGTSRVLVLGTLGGALKSGTT